MSIVIKYQYVKGLGRSGLAFFIESCNILFTMASQENLVRMVNKATGFTYMTRKNRKKLAGVKLKLRKYDPVLRKVAVFTEGKKA